MSRLGRVGEQAFASNAFGTRISVFQTRNRVNDLRIVERTISPQGKREVQVYLLPSSGFEGLTLEQVAIELVTE